MRRGRKLRARRIQAEHRRLRYSNLSLATIHNVLKRHSVGPLVRLRPHAEPKRYSRPISPYSDQNDLSESHTRRCASSSEIERFDTGRRHRREPEEARL